MLSYSLCIVVIRQRKSRRKKNSNSVDSQLGLVSLFDANLKAWEVRNITKEINNCRTEMIEIVGV